MEKLKQALAFAIGADPEGPAVSGWRAYGFTLLRIWIGLAIAVHGFGTITDAARIEGFAGYLGKLGVPLPGVSAWAAKGTEAFGGLLLAAGLMTRPAALALAGTLLVAVLTAHGNDPLFAAPGKPSKEMAMLYLVPFVAFLVMGPGPHALDRFVQRFAAEKGIGVKEG